MKKLIGLFTLLILLSLTSSWTTKNKAKNNESRNSTELTKGLGHIWIVRFEGQDEMDCYSGGQSDCPIIWFLQKK
jgi:hypothetical protein